MNITLRQNISLPICENPLISAFSDLSERLFTAESEKLNRTIGETEEEKKLRTVKKDGGYKCIHLPVNHFLRNLENVLEKENVDYLNFDCFEHKRKKFIDVGCGVGQKVYLAGKVFNLDSYGLELRKPFVERANEIINFNKNTYDYMGYKETEDKIFQADALKYDEYNNFDIIYFYCPIYDVKLQIELEKKIAKDAKKGAILMPFLSKYFDDNRFEKEIKQFGWIQIDKYYWKKTK